MSCLSSKERRTYHSSKRPGFHPTMFTASNKKTATPDWLSTWRLIEQYQYSTIFNILTDKMYLFRRELKIQAFRNNCFVWVGHHTRKSSKKPQREMKKCLKILRTTFQAKNKPASISVFFPWLHSTQLLIASPVCFIFICIICIIILILILILLNIMFMMRLYCGICIECPGRRVGQMRSPSFPKHLFESFWKSNATLSPVLGRNAEVWKMQYIYAHVYQISWLAKRCLRFIGSHLMFSTFYHIFTITSITINNQIFLLTSKTFYSAMELLEYRFHLAFVIFA